MTELRPRTVQRPGVVPGRHRAPSEHAPWRPHTGTLFDGDGPAPGSVGKPASADRIAKPATAVSIAKPASDSIGKRASGRIAGLDGLRAIAVLGVVIFHLRPATLPGGFLGVDVFFVVSGFLITTLLLRERGATGEIDLGGFWKRRARRLVPALVAVVLVMVPFAWLANTDLLVGIGRQVIGALTFTTNWVEIGAGSSYFNTTAPTLFAHFWSLAVEEQFYLLWPLLLFGIMFTTTKARQRIGVAVAGAAVSAFLMGLLVVPGQDATRVYYGTDTHAFSLLVGVSLAFWWAKPQNFLTTARWDRWRVPAAATSFVALLVLMFVLAESKVMTFRGGILIGAVLTAVLIASLLGGGESRVQSVLESPKLKWVGQRSYGIYLWHWPLIVVLTLLIRTAVDSFGHWMVRLLALVLTVGFAAVSYRYLETPIRRSGFRESFRRARSALAGAVPVPRTRLAGTAIVATVLVALLGVGTVSAIAVAPDKTATQQAIEAAQNAAAPVKNVKDARNNELNKPAKPDPRSGLPKDADYSMPKGKEMTAFGDSLIVTSLTGLQSKFPGINVEAKSNRQWGVAPSVVQNALNQGIVRRAVVIHFGTNAGLSDPKILQKVLDMLGPKRMVVVMNLYSESTFVPDSNAKTKQIVAKYPNAIVGDWHDVAAQHPDELQADQTHPDMDGAVLYAGVVKSAFKQLAKRLKR